MQQQRTSMDEKWLTYILLVLTYTLAVVNDWLSAIIFTLLLLQLVGLINRIWLFIAVEIVLISDLVLKSPYIGVNSQQFMLDVTCVKLIFQEKIKPIVFVYIGLHVYNLYLCVIYFINRNINARIRIKSWGPLMTQVMVYTQPLIMYTVSIITNYYPFRVLWAVLACLQVLDIFPTFNHFLCCALITCYFFVPQLQPQYKIPLLNNNTIAISQQNTNYIVITLFIFMLILINVYSNPHPQYKQDIRKSLSITRRALRRQIQQQQQKLKRKSIIVLALAILLCLITTSLGNIFIIFGIYLNIPQFKSKRFFFFTGFGIVLSLILQPEQISYFVYLYLVILVIGQQITNTQIIQYQVHSYSFFLDFYKLYIMLSHVSFLNWLIGIFRNSSIVTLAISIRIFCRYFNYVSVFLGTNDDYGIMEVRFINMHSLSDLVLIVYLIFLCLYSPSKTKTYGNSNITNILLQYPILQKIRKIFVIFRAFNWLSYIIFSLIILSRKPSLYITIHIFYLVLILICDTINTQTTTSKLLKKYKLLKFLWNINFYVTFVMIFTRYLYFLKQYQSNSEFMDNVLGILTEYKFWIGLDQLSKETQGFALVKYFMYDWSVLILSWVNVYVYSVKIYYQSIKQQDPDYQERERQRYGLNSPLLDQYKNQQQQNKMKQSITNSQYTKQQSKLQQKSAQKAPQSQQKQQSQQQQQQQQYLNTEQQSLFYFYNRYIKPIDLTTYLANHQYKILQKILRDCLLDLCFGIIVLAFYLQKQSVDYVFYLPHFIINAYAYYYRFIHGLTLQYTQKILGLCSAYSFVILFSSYLYITFLQIYDTDNEIPSAIVKMYITYILCIVICFLYKACCCIPIRQSIQQKQKDYHCIIYLCFPFTVKSQKLWTQILSIFSQFWMAFTMSLFFTNIFSPKLISTIVHPFIVIYLLLVKIGKQKSQTWLYIVCIISIIDIWNYDFFAYFTILAVTIFYAVKNGQKLSQQQFQGSYRDQISDQASVILQFPQLQQQPQPDCQQKKWSYYIAYCTLIWMLPQIISLLWMFGVVWLSPSIIATLLIAFSYGNLLFQLLKQKQTKISQPLLIITLGITVLFFLYELFQYLIRLIVPDMERYDHSEMGLFLIFDSCFFYLILKKRAAWYAKRGNDARLYWSQKAQLIGQLGSQLHNQKKLITLQKYYSSKQKLTQKVNKISAHLKQNSKKTYIQSLDSILLTKDPKQQSYQLYTNMLIFLDIQLLKKCFLMLNQYITASKSQNVVEKAKVTRHQIYRTYQRSFNQAFHRLKTQSQNYQQHNSNILHQTSNIQNNSLTNNKQQQLPQPPLLAQISRTSTINLQKINQINQRYKRCFEIITKSTQQFNRIIRLIIQNLQIISMMIVIGWNLFGGVYTIPTNILIFGWAIVLQNKTTIVFWILVMSYTCLILMMKQIIVYLPSIYIIDFIFYYHGDDYLYQYFLVLISVVQITLIKLGGTRYKTYSERQSIYDAFYRAALNKAANKSELDKQQDFMDIYKNLTQPQNHSFWYRVFSKSRFKPGKDFYPLMSTIQLIILLYIFFFYDMMELQSKKNRKSIGQLLTVSQFSSHMVIALFLQIMIMILDRFIISLNLVDEENQALQNFFLSFTFSITQVKQAPPKKLDKVGIFDFLLVLKYLFHLSLLIVINFFVYFYIPSAGLTKSLIPTCSENQCNKSYTYLSIFLILYFSYFLVSGLQIKHGFNRNKCKNVLMEKFHWINYYTYKIFTAIPFAWQFKKICDWTVTSTALPLFHWMKFQDINARLYQSKCQAEMIKIKPLGTPWNKYFLGPCGFMAILLLVFSPFIIYSPVNPFAVKDAVIGSRTDIYLKMDDRYDYKFFSTSHATVAEKTELNLELKLTNQNLFLIKMSRFPDQNFLLSEPVVQKLTKQIQKNIIKNTHKFSFVLYLNVIQQQGGQSKTQWANKQLSSNDQENLCNFLKLKTNNITLQKFYSPFPGQLPLQSITISSPNAGQYFQVELNRINQNGKQLYFYYLTSNKFKVAVGILTFYLTYILVISRLLRFYLTGTVRNIIYEGCYLESILVLCQAVREARIVQNFLQEESFYFELMDIMRHPKALKQITGDFLAFRKKYI